MNTSEMYTQGSAACQNYSRLTMQVRTLAQHILVAYALSLAAFSAYVAGKNGVDSKTIQQLLTWSGGILILFAGSLSLINWHYQSAFEAIRDSLAELERWGSGYDGPWRVHQKAREGWPDKVSTHSPFIVLAIVGALVTFLGCAGMANSCWVAGIFALVAAGWISLVTVFSIIKFDKLKTTRRNELRKIPPREDPVQAEELPQSD